MCDFTLATPCLFQTKGAELETRQAISSHEIACASCTFLNPPLAKACGICESALPKQDELSIIDDDAGHERRGAGQGGEFAPKRLKQSPG